MAKRLLILGNSAAAVSAVRAIRRSGCDWPLTVVSREACNAYSPVLTTYYLRDAIEEKGMFVCDASFYLDRAVERRFGRSAVALDTSRHVVHLDNGEEIVYDQLLIATGASAKKLEVNEAVGSRLMNLRTIEDAQIIRDQARTATRVAVVGGGLVSLQVATAIARPGLTVTSIVSSGQILSQNVDSRAASLIQEHAERSADIRFLFGRDVVAIRQEGEAVRLLLDSDEVVLADLVVVGKGVDPNLEFVDPAQVAVDRGILVDEHLRTSLDHVYAAGDVAQGLNVATGKRELVANWIDACEQGRIAGLNMVGSDAVYEGSVPQNITTVFGLPVASVGITRGLPSEPGSREVALEDQSRGRYRKLSFRDGRLVGALLVGDIAEAGPLRAAIANGGEPRGLERHILRGELSQADRLHDCLYGAQRNSAAQSLSSIRQGGDSCD
jgi:NAD(P)H-nitrite reductase large subunit